MADQEGNGCNLEEKFQYTNTKLQTIRRGGQNNQ